MEVIICPLVVDNTVGQVAGLDILSKGAAEFLLFFRMLIGEVNVELGKSFFIVLVGC